MMQIDLAKVLSSIPSIAWLGFSVACLVLSILYYTRTKRKPFLLLSISFLLSVVKDVCYILLPSSFIFYLITVLNYTEGMAALIYSLAVTLPTMVMAGFAAVLLLIALIQFYKEREE